MNNGLLTGLSCRGSRKTVAGNGGPALFDESGMLRPGYILPPERNLPEVPVDGAPHGTA
jgi:hypothetical protein